MYNNNLIKKESKVIDIIIICMMIVNLFPLFIMDINSVTISDKQKQFATRETQLIKFNYDPIVDYEFAEKQFIQIKKSQAEETERIKQEAYQKQLEEEKRLKEIEAKTVFASTEISVNNIDVFTDLAIMQTVNADQMNQIIDYWASKCGGTPFVGMGQAFIDASKQSGLDPIYILAHAALESGWGNSNISEDKYNFFGIGAFDDSPYSSSYIMGDSIYTGIVNGAVWISNNYYKNGQTCLYTMRYNHGKNQYCTSDTWMYDISSIMQTSYSMIE